jgi:hypothetical protein
MDAAILFLLVVGLILYFVPTIIAGIRNSEHHTAIFVIRLWLDHSRLVCRLDMGNRRKAATRSQDSSSRKTGAAPPSHQSAVVDSHCFPLAKRSGLAILALAFRCFCLSSPSKNRCILRAASADVGRAGSGFGKCG